MKAIEINSQTDNSGYLKLNYQLNRKNSKVRLLILLSEEEVPEEENLWLQSISSNPAFDFLNDPEEDIYSLKDGQPL